MGEHKMVKPEATLTADQYLQSLRDLVMSTKDNEKNQANCLQAVAIHYGECLACIEDYALRKTFALMAQHSFEETQTRLVKASKQIIIVGGTNAD